MNDANVTFEAPLLRGRFLVYNQKPSLDLMSVKQTHSNIVHSEENCHHLLEGDGIIGTSSNPKAILTADCLPIVLIGQNGHAVIHAGWKGLSNKILLNDLVKSISPTYAFIGPHIRQDQYEVQADFLAHFPDNLSAFKNINSKIYFDMALTASQQLADHYKNIVIEDCNLCTLLDSKFHSYRRNQTPNRNWNVYIPNTPN